MTEPGRWLDERREPAPQSIRTEIDALLAESDPSAPLPDQFAAAALRALEAIVAEPSERATAWTLLAADALLTYACEAAAEEGIDALDVLTRSLDFERFSELMLSR
ncbi:MAG: hypothetical protein R6U63_13665 [Longimicrobiales bacterium]